LTLEQTVLAGLKANPSVESARQILEQSQLNVKAARGSFVPSFTVQSSFSKYSLSGDVLTVDNLNRERALRVRSCNITKVNMNSNLLID
jgi:outer membrane protein TolC